MIILENVRRSPLRAIGHTSDRIVVASKPATTSALGEVVSAGDYGVPQERLGLFIVANQADMGRIFDVNALLETARKVAIKTTIM